MDAKEFIQKTRSEEFKILSLKTYKGVSVMDLMEAYATQSLPGQISDEEIEEQANIYSVNLPEDWNKFDNKASWKQGFKQAINRTALPREGECNHQFVEAKNIEFTDGTEIEKAMVCVKCQAVKHPKHLRGTPHKG